MIPASLFKTKLTRVRRVIDSSGRLAQPLPDILEFRAYYEEDIGISRTQDGENKTPRSQIVAPSGLDIVKGDRIIEGWGHDPATIKNTEIITRVAPMRDPESGQVHHLEITIGT